jgi:transposase InsO family protein
MRQYVRCIFNQQETLNGQNKRLEIFNIDQGSQYSGKTFTGALKDHGVETAWMGRCIDNIFIERLWRFVKYKKIILGEFETVHKLLSGLKEYFKFFQWISHLGNFFMSLIYI